MVRRIKLWGPWEVRAALGVGRTRFDEIVARKDFPEPADDTLRLGKIWFQDEVEAWIAEHRKPRDEPIAEDPEGDAG